MDSDQLLSATGLPKQMIVVGAGVIGLEYASMLTALGSTVTVIDQRPALLDFLDQEIIEALSYHMRRQGATFRLGETVIGVDIDARGRVVARLESGKTVTGDALLYTVGRQGNTDGLGLETVGLETDKRGRIPVNTSFQTSIPHIYAAGDVIGFPSLASTSMEQGRLAACHMFGLPCVSRPELLPYGVYSVPEISMVGKTEQELTAARIPYEVGLARAVLGVHAIGEGAAEIIHIGQAVLTLGGTLEYFRDTVFNYPTLAEAYKVAALNGLNKL